MSNPRITVSGLAEAKQALAEINDLLSIEKLSMVLADAIDLIRQEAARNVQANLKQDTGSLLLASLITKPGKNPNMATAWTKAGGKIAPHARLVEYGHRIVGPMPNKTATGASVSPHPFFRPALDAKRAEVRARVTQGIQNLLAGKETRFEQLVQMTNTIKARKRAERKARKAAKKALQP
jgi:hypothetical protein